MLRKTTITTVVAIAAAGWVSACGSTSNIGAGSTAQAAQAGQICGQQSAAKPGYARTIPKIDGGANTLSGAGSTFVAPIMSMWAKAYSQ